jgi:hypothetical protein
MFVGETRKYLNYAKTCQLNTFMHVIVLRIVLSNNVMTHM